MSRALSCALFLSLFVKLTTTATTMNAGCMDDSETPRQIEFVRAELPNMQCPATMIVDDGSPIIGDPESSEIQKQWNALKRFSELCEEHGAKGKFTVIPFKSGYGMIDKIAEPSAKAELNAYCDFIRAKITPRFDITPEIVSHGPVINIETGAPLERKPTPEELRRDAVADLSGEWKFKPAASADSSAAFASANFDDSSWRAVSIPGPFETPVDSCDEIGWFRKKFKTGRWDGKTRLFLIARGIEQGSSIYLNGQLAGEEKQRRLDCIDITERLNKDADNTIALKVSNLKKFTGVGGCVQIGELELHPELFNEAQWSRKQDAKTLDAYIGYALTSLKNAGLDANGVTSPWDFGSGNDENYVSAIGSALKRVEGIQEAWYFLNMSPALRQEPKLMSFNWMKKEYVASVVASSEMLDLFVAEAAAGDPSRQADAYISLDGKSGAIPRLLANRSYCVMCCHWGMLLKGETALYEKVFSRMRKQRAGEFQWMKCSEMARYFVAAKTVRTMKDSDGNWLFESAVACPDFTASFIIPNGQAKRFLVDNAPLVEDKSRGVRLEKNSWRQEGRTIYACFDLKEKNLASIELEQ